MEIKKSSGKTIDSGVKVWVGLRYGSKSLRKTNLDRVNVKQLSNGVKEADIIFLILIKTFMTYMKIKKY